MIEAKQEKSEVPVKAEHDYELDDATNEVARPPPKAVITQIKLEDGVEDTSSAETSASESEGETELEDQESGRLVDWKGQALPKTASTDINHRLTSFFSQLAEQRAQPGGENNEVIEHGTDSDSGYEEDDDGKQYVELDLALGVLSEKEEDGDDEVKLPKSEVNKTQEESSSEEEALQTLKSVKRRRRGQSGKPKKRKIEEVS